MKTASNKHPQEKVDNKDKWTFEDYAFSITGIIVGVLLVVPPIIYTEFGISILGEGADFELQEIFEALEDGSGLIWDINRLRSLSPLLFLLTLTICYFKDAFDAKKNGGYKGSLFTHTYESLFEESIYMTITTIMVYGAVLFGAMYASWLSGPISWFLFVFLFPLFKGKNDSDDDEVPIPWLCLFIFVIGIIAEVMTGVWIAFPLAWLVICAIKFLEVIREKINSYDAVFNVLYYAFSVILLAVGLIRDFWIVSWVAFPVAIFICWVLSKFNIFKNVEADTP